MAQYQQALAAARPAVGTIAAEVDPAAPDARQRLQALAPEVVLAIGQRSAALARETLPQTPIVVSMVLKKSAGFSRTVTGIPLEVGIREQLERFHKVYPAAKRLGLVYSPSAAGDLLKDASEAASALGLTLVARPVSDPKQIRTAAAELIGSIDALWLLPDPKLITKEVFTFLLVFMMDRRVPTLGFVESFTNAGALASVSPDFAEAGRRAGVLVAEIANRPADRRLPVPAPVVGQGKLSINMKTAAQLGIRVPEAAVGSADMLVR